MTLPPDVLARIDAMVADAPPFSPEQQRILRQLFAAEREQAPPGAHQRGHQTVGSMIAPVAAAQ
jgi:hypothetical protein